MTQSFDDLFDALRKDNVEIFRSQLQTCGWPTYSQWSGYDLLAEAIKFGRKNVAKFLLDLECRVTKPGNRNTLVHVALAHPDWTGVVVKRIELGAPVSSVKVAGETAVHAAFKNNTDGQMIDLLLANYVQESVVNVKNAEGLSVLHIACSRPSLQVVQALTYRSGRVIVTRQDVNRQVLCDKRTSYSRYTPLHFAVKNGHMEIAKFLTRHLHVDIYKVDANSSTSLHFALERRDIEILDCLLAYDKVHDDVVNNAGLSHFMAACAGSNASIAAEYLRLTQHRPWTSPESLITKRTEESSDSSYRGYSALHFAAKFGRLETVELLLAHGASCFVLSAENLTPMVLAIKRGHEDVYRLLWRRYKAYRQTLYEAIDEEERSRLAPRNGSPTDVAPPSFIRQRIPMSPSRSGLNNKTKVMLTRVGGKPVGFNNPLKWMSKIAPDFDDLAKVVSCRLIF